MLHLLDHVLRVIPVQHSLSDSIDRLSRTFFRQLAILVCNSFIHQTRVVRSILNIGSLLIKFLSERSLTSICHLGRLVILFASRSLFKRLLVLTDWLLTASDMRVLHFTTNSAHHLMDFVSLQTADVSLRNTLAQMLIVFEHLIVVS